jgi:hypothetical protein
MRLAYGAIVFAIAAFALIWILAVPFVEDGLSSVIAARPTIPTTPPLASATMSPSATIRPDDSPTPSGTDGGGLADSDLDLTLIDGNTDPPSALLLMIRNYGRADFAGEVEVVCSGGGILRSALLCPDCPAQHPIELQVWAWMEIPAAFQERALVVSLGGPLDPWNFSYRIECTIAAESDPNSRNNRSVYGYP